jgi:hypothetical protein
MLLAYFIFIFTLLDAAAEFFQVFLFFRVHSIYCRTRVVRNSTFVPASASCLDFLPLLSILCFLSLHPAYNCNLCCLFVFIYATTPPLILQFVPTLMPLPMPLLMPLLMPLVIPLLLLLLILLNTHDFVLYEYLQYTVIATTYTSPEVSSMVFFQMS